VSVFSSFDLSHANYLTAVFMPLGIGSVSPFIGFWNCRIGSAIGSTPERGSPDVPYRMSSPIAGFCVHTDPRSLLGWMQFMAYGSPVNRRVDGLRAALLHKSVLPWSAGHGATRGPLIISNGRYQCTRWHLYSSC